MSNQQFGHKVIKFSAKIFEQDHSISDDFPIRTDLGLDSTKEIPKVKLQSLESDYNYHTVRKYRPEDIGSDSESEEEGLPIAGQFCNNEPEPTLRIDDPFDMLDLQT